MTFTRNVNKVRRRVKQLADEALIGTSRMLPRKNPIVIDNSSPRVSVISVSFNSLVWTKLMLLTLSEHLPQDIQNVVIADNGSTDGSIDFLARLHARAPRIAVIQNRAHRHHAGGLRAAISALGDLEADLPAHEKTNLYLIADSDIIFLRSDLLQDMVKVMTEENASLVGQIQHDVGEPYVHPCCCLLRRSDYEDRRVWPFTNHGAPALKLQQSMYRARMKIVDFPARSEEYIVHLGGGSIAGIQAFAPRHEYSTLKASPHYHGYPPGKQLWEKTEARFQELLTPDHESDAIEYIARRFSGEQVD